MVWINGEAHYDLGNYLGGGAAGVVYEAANLKSAGLGHGSDGPNKNVAVKILNPVGFKLMPNGPLQRCIVARKGVPLIPGSPMGLENVWWVVHPNSRAVIAAHQEPRTGQLRELPLPRCIEIWGWDPLNEGNLSEDDGDLNFGTSCSGRSMTRERGRGGRGPRSKRPSEDGHAAPGSPVSHHQTPPPRGTPTSPADGGGSCMSDEALEKLAKSGDAVLVEGSWIALPRVPPKYVKWLRARQGIYKEIANMSHLGAHQNVVGLYEVLEYVQDSKSTLFLVLELVTGGELFDRIQIGRGTSETTAQRYFRQLIDGVGYCHAKGVCHRDLKPENLLLSDSGGGAVLKIADFGLSAAFAIAANGAAEEKAEGRGTPVSMRRLRSVVGSPHYVAPEVTTESVAGYDGPKADVWSAGVILYAILAGNLPFGKELAHCPRFAQFRKWIGAHEVVCLGGGAGVRINELSDADEGGPSSPARPASHSHSPSHSRPPSESAKKAAFRIQERSAQVLDALEWFFPGHFSTSAQLLLVTMLHPEASQRPTMEQVAQHAWVARVVYDCETSSSNSSSTAAAAAAAGSNGNRAAGGAEDTTDAVVRSVGRMGLDQQQSTHFFG